MQMTSKYTLLTFPMNILLQLILVLLYMSHYLFTLKCYSNEVGSRCIDACLGTRNMFMTFVPSMRPILCIQTQPFFGMCVFLACIKYVNWC